MGKTTVYGHCAAGCKRPVVAKEELTLVTREEYAELEANGELVEDCVYVITNDTTVEELANRLEQFNSVMEGEEAVPKAEQDGDGNKITDTYATKEDLKNIYQHTINFAWSEAGSTDIKNRTSAHIAIINSSQEQFTKETLRDFLAQFDVNGYPVSGFTADSSGKVYPLISAWVGVDKFGEKGALYFSYTDCTTTKEYDDATEKAYSQFVGHQYKKAPTGATEYALSDLVVQLL